MKKVLQITVHEVDEEKGAFMSEIQIMCNPIALIGALSEAIYKINQSVNSMEALPKNAIWTTVCEIVSDKMLEDSKRNA